MVTNHNVINRMELLLKTNGRMRSDVKRTTIGLHSRSVSSSRPTYLSLLYNSLHDLRDEGLPCILRVG